VLPLFPETVTLPNNPDGYYGLTYERFTPFLVKGIQELDLNLHDMDTRVAALEANINNSDIGSQLGQYALDFFHDGVQSVVDGIVYMKGLVVGTLEVGSPTARTGVTLYDEITGDPYCLSIANGVSKTTPGKCQVFGADPNALPPQGGGNGGGGNGGQGGDVTPPAITLNGLGTIHIVVGETYNEEGATAADDVDGSVAVVVSGSVDTATPGTYTISYDASDAANNHAVTVTRTVYVDEVTP
jgi:hypothetical protein